jgi:sec-independent protein translocase protein TatC
MSDDKTRDEQESFEDGRAEESPETEAAREDADGGSGGDDSGGNGSEGSGRGGDDSGGSGGDEEDEDKERLEEMTLTDHLEELRSRLVRMFIGAFVGFLACYGFAERMFEALMAPLKPLLPENSHLIFTGLPEGFFTYIKLSIVAGVFLASPYLFAQIWLFISPALYSHERKWLIPIAFFSALFFVSGALFGYFVVFPFAFKFFMGFATDVILPMPSLKEYLSFTLKLLIAFGLAFELPLFIFFLARLGLVNSRKLRKFRKYAFLLAFCFSAVLTPPDIVSQLFMAGPLILLFEVGIWVAHFFGKKEKPKPAADEEAA